MPRPKEGKKPVTVYLDEPLYKEAKKAAIDDGVQFMEFLEGLIAEAMGRRGKK
jgi:hypothetical protein